MYIPFFMLPCYSPGTVLDTYFHLHRARYPVVWSQVDFRKHCYCCCSVTQSCSTLCNPMDCSMPGFPVLHHLPELDQAQTQTHWKSPWCWKWLKMGRQVDDKGWDGWTASPTQWTWVWAGSGSWCWTGKCGMLQSMGLQRVRHDWVAE